MADAVWRIIRVPKVCRVKTRSPVTQLALETTRKYAMSEEASTNLAPATVTIQKRPSTSDLQSTEVKKPKTDETTKESVTEMSAPINTKAVEEKTVPLQIKKLVDNARLPTRGSAAAAGWDLHSAEDTVIPAGGRKLVSTGLAMAIPGGCCTSIVMHPLVKVILIR